MTRTVAGFQFSVLGSPKWVGFALLRDLDPRVCQDESMVGRSLMSVPPRWRKAARMAPEVGFEPTTNRLTADRSTTELLRSIDGRKS